MKKLLISLFVIMMNCGVAFADVIPNPTFPNGPEDDGEVVRFALGFSLVFVLIIGFYALKKDKKVGDK